MKVDLVENWIPAQMPLGPLLWISASDLSIDALQFDQVARACVQLRKIRGAEVVASKVDYSRATSTIITELIVRVDRSARFGDGPRTRG